ncbi:hypothetical protein V2J09_004829 [Rumex salicifolius]
MTGGREITAEEVISKLKDDGDFDRLRLKIIRKLKDNEELRSSIAEVVKQSAALNRPDAEFMKPRELSDVIHDEIREKVMSQISDGLWEIIKSTNGMKGEITEAVQSVYDKLNPPAKMEDELASSSHVLPMEDNTHDSPKHLSDNQIKESTGFEGQSHTSDEQMGWESERDPHLGVIQQMEVGVPSHAPGQSDEDGDKKPPPGFSLNGSDDELDVPPGFG